MNKNNYSIKEYLVSDQTCFILPHKLPDGDTIGSAFGLYEYVKHYFKEVYIVSEYPMPPLIEFMNHIPLSRLEDVKGIKPDVVFVVDSSDLLRVDDRKEVLDGAFVINIDHHHTNEMYGDVNIVDAEASSTGEMIYRILKEDKVAISAEMGQALYVAISTDTGSLQYSSTKPSTFRACADLLESGFDFDGTNVWLYHTKPFDKIKLLQLAMETLTFDESGKIAVLHVDHKMVEDSGLEGYDTDGIVEYVRDIKGVEVVGFIRQLEGDLYKISMRSKFDKDVSAIAVSFGGGGHKKAAGYSMEGKIADVREKLLEALS